MRLIRMLFLAVLATALAAPHAAAATPEQYIDSAFPYIAGEGGAPRLPMGELTSPDSPGKRYFKVRDNKGSVAHLYAHGPFAFAEGNQVASVNTDLVAAEGGWRAASVPFDVVIPSDLDDGILWRDAGRGESVRVYPQNVNSSPGRIYEGSTDTVIYDQVWNHAYMTVAVTPNGVKDHIILTQANGVPNQFKFRVERPEGARTEITAAGAVHVIAAEGTVLAQLPAPVARDRDHQEFKIWYEVENHGRFDVIVLRYDTSPITAEGGTITYEAPFDLDPAIYSGSLVHGENAFRETSLNAYTVSDFNDGNLKASLLKVPSYDAGKFARWYITPPPAGSRWYSFSARVEGRVGITQKYSLTDDAGARYTFGPAAAAGTYFAQDVSFTPQGDVNSRIEATSKSTPLYDYYGQLTNPVVIYEDLVDPILTDLRPNGSTITASEVTLRLGMRDAQSGCGTITVTLHGPVAPIGTRTGSGCTFAPAFNLRTEGMHRIDVALTDRSGRRTAESASFTFDSPIDPPTPPVIDGDNPEVDQDWTNQTTTFSASWNAAPGATGYQLCFTAAAPCAADDRWTGFTARTGTVADYAFQHGQTVAACVRSVTSSGIRTTPTCSDGQHIDLSPPEAPARVDDGLMPGADSDRTISTFEAGATWPASSDANSGVAGYESCITLLAAQCNDEQRWFEIDPAAHLGDLSTVERFMLELGNSYKVCIRAFDQVDNMSAATCSNGQRVNPSELEIDQNINAREELGLPAGETFVRSTLLNPPADGTIDSYGFTATNQEAAFLATSFAVQDAASIALEGFAAKHPESYGGYFVDTDSGKTVLNLSRPAPLATAALLGQVRASCRNATIRTKKLRDRASRGKRKVRSLACSESLVLRRVRYSERVLMLIQERMFAADAAKMKLMGIDITRAGIDAEANRLVVGINPDSAISTKSAERALNHFYTRYRRDKTGPIRVNEAAMATLARGQVRPARNNSYRLVSSLSAGTLVSYPVGSDSIYTCTSGFMLRGIGGGTVSVSADHCMKFHTPMYSSWDGVGSNHYRLGMPGAGYTRRGFDLRELNLDQNVRIAPKIYRRYPAPPTGPPVDFTTVTAGTQQPGRGTWICRSSNSDDSFTRAGISCTVVHRVNQRYSAGGRSYIGDQMAATGARFRGRMRTCTGDSGGPVYRATGYFTARAVGIASATHGPLLSVSPENAPDNECYNGYMDYASLRKADFR